LRCGEIDGDDRRCPRRAGLGRPRGRRRESDAGWAARYRWVVVRRELRELLRRTGCAGDDLVRRLGASRERFAADPVREARLTER
jgi:hypothetical protein